MYGRAAELDRIRAFLDDVEARPAAPLTEGPAGIGKTTLRAEPWLEAPDQRAVAVALLGVIRAPTRLASGLLPASARSPVSGVRKAVK